MYPVASNEPGTDEDKRDAFVEDVRDVADGRGRADRRGGRHGRAGHRRRQGLRLARRTAALHHRRRRRRAADPHLPQPGAVAGAARRRPGSPTTCRWASPTASAKPSAPRVAGQSSGIMTDPRLRRRHGLRPAARLPLPGGAAPRTSGRTTPWWPRCAAAGPPCSPPPATVAAGLLCLLAADLNSSRGHGPGRHGRRAVRARSRCDAAARASSSCSAAGCSGRWCPPTAARPGARGAVRRDGHLGRTAPADRPGGRRRPARRARPGRAEPARHRSSRRTPSPTGPSRSSPWRRAGRGLPGRGAQPIAVITPAGAGDATLAASAARRASRRADGPYRGRLDRDRRHRDERTRSPPGETATIKALRDATCRGLLRRRGQRPADRPGGHQRPGPDDRRPARPRLGAADPDGAAAVPRRAADAGRRRGRGVGRRPGHRRAGLRAGARLRGHGSRARPAVLRVPGRPRRRLRHLPDAPDAGGVLPAPEPAAAALTALRTTGGVIASAGSSSPPPSPC